MLSFWLCVEVNENGTAHVVSTKEKKKGKEKGGFLFESWSDKIRRIGVRWSCGAQHRKALRRERIKKKVIFNSLCTED